MCRFTCVRVHGQIRGNPLESAASFGHGPFFVLGREGQGLSLTWNLLSRLGCLTSEPVFAFQGWDFKGSTTSSFVLFLSLRLASKDCAHVTPARPRTF